MPRIILKRNHWVNKRDVSSRSNRFEEERPWLRYQAMIEFIYGKERNLSRGQVLQPRDCSYIGRAENILISGATGSGKSFVVVLY